MVKGDAPQPDLAVVLEPDGDGWIQFFDLPGLPDHWVWVRVERVQGIPAITGLKIEPARIHGYAGPDFEATPDAAITAERLSALPWRLLRESAIPIARRDVASGVEAFDENAMERHGRSWPVEHYERVAAVYRDAVDAGAPPLKAIQARWGVSRAAASKYVKKARALGVLGYPNEPGLPGYQSEISPITGMPAASPQQEGTER